MSTIAAEALRTQRLVTVNMIRPEKIDNALYAVQLILVRARFMAQQEEPPKDLAKLLDYAEMLPRLTAVKEDMTEKYREYLQGIVESFPVCRYILEKFDELSAPPKW